MTVVNEQILSEMHKRNIERAKQMREQMGTRFLCHPSNKVVRKDLRPGVLEIPRYLMKNA